MTPVFAVANDASVSAHDFSRRFAAGMLVALGAQQVTLDGATHRVQDDPRASQALREHWAG